MGRKKKYQTEEERKQAIKEYSKQYYQANRERLKEQLKQYRKEYYKQYRKENAEKIKKYNKEYYKQYYQENVEQIKEYNKEYYNENAEYYKQYYQDNAEQIKEYVKQYRQTPMGRASILLGAYNQADRKANRGKGDLTAKWIVERIFSQPCAHCGKEGWEVIGCNRLDNSLPHSKDNVEPCCLECNCKVSGGRPIKIQNDNS